MECISTAYAVIKNIRRQNWETLMLFYKVMMTAPSC